VAKSKSVLTEAIARQLAVKASVCPKTIQKVAAGLPVRGLPGYRARAALVAAGFPVPDPVPAEDRGSTP
jgi:hypothetical protein